MAVRTWGITPIGSGGRRARMLWPGAASRVSSRAAWSWSRYSAREASASSSLRSPRFQQRLPVLGAHRGLGVDAAVHVRQRVAGVVALVVAVAPVADHVDHGVLVEPLAVGEGQAGGPHAGLGVVAVHVEDRCADHLGHVGGVLRGAGRVRRGGEPELVVDHQVDGPADAVPLDEAQVEGLGHHALPREGGVPVDQQRHHRVGAVGAVGRDVVHAGPGHAHHHRVDGLEVGGVGGQLHQQVLARRALVGADLAEVVLDVAACPGSGPR